MSDARERADGFKENADEVYPWKLKSKQLIAVVILIVVIAAQIIWAFRSIAGYEAERRQFVSQETDIASLTFTQRESFTLLQK
jgi:hypothetical protein